MPMLIYKLVDLLSPDLCLRSDADFLFDSFSKDESESIEIDFSNIETISGTFAHQYLKRRDSSSIRIIESNMPDNIRKMMEAIKRPSTSPRFENVVRERHTTFL